MNQVTAPGRFGLAPFFTEDGPQHLVQELTVLEERPPEHTFLNASEFIA